MCVSFCEFPSLTVFLILTYMFGRFLFFYSAEFFLLKAVKLCGLSNRILSYASTPNTKTEEQLTTCIITLPTGNFNNFRTSVIVGPSIGRKTRLD